MSNSNEAFDRAGFLADQPRRILDAEGRHAWRKGAVAGLLTHVKGEPVLLVMRSDLRGRGVAIPKGRLPLYVDEKAGTARPTLVAKAREIAQLIGIDTLDVNVNNIMDMVLFQADDLRKME